MKDVYTQLLGISTIAAVVTAAVALLMWGKEKLDGLPERAYGPGDAWFSSTDGIHGTVSFAHFPRMEFPVYRELGQLLRKHYRDEQ